MEARAHTKQAGSGFSNPVWMEGQPRAMPDRSRTPLKLEAKSPEEADALLLDLYTPVFAELGKPSTPRLGPQTFRGKAQLLLMAASDRPDMIDYILDKRAKVAASSVQCCGEWLCGPLHQCSLCLERLARSAALSHVATALVLLNMGMMCMPYHGMSDRYAARLEEWTSYCTLAFIAEMVLKLCGLGWGTYWTDGWNAMDGAITLLAIFEMAATSFALAESGEVPKVSFLRILRMLRVVRMLRLMKSWKGLYHIVMTLGKSLPQMANLFVLMFLIMVIFALLGMQAFGGAFVPATGFSQDPCPGGACPDASLEPLPYRHFDYFGPAMSTVFVLMTGEWWDATQPASAVLGAKTLLYFIPVVLIGRYLIMNLFIGILLHAFSEEDEEEEATARSESEGNVTCRAASAGLGSGTRGLSTPQLCATTPSKSPVCASPMGPAASPDVAVSRSAKPNTAQKPSDGSNLVAAKDGLAAGSSGDEIVGSAITRDAEPRWPRDYSMLIFSPRNPVRLLCRYLISLDVFDPLVIFIILASSVCMALDSPLNEPEGKLAITLRKLDLVWTVVFTLELLLKSVARGFACAKDAYLSSAWNQLDFAIVCISWLVLASEVFPQFASLRALRVLRALRPLRLVQRNPGMRLIVTSLVKALPEVLDAFLVVLALQSVFAILGMQLYMGALASCTDPAITTELACTDKPPFMPPPPGPPPPPSSIEPSSSTAFGRLLSSPLPEATHLRRLKGGGGGGSGWDGGPVRWVNPGFGSFDDFGSAMRLLYIMASGDEWEAPMYAMQAARSPGDAPVRNDYDFAGAFFAVAWMFIGSFFALNLFVGVICDSFDRIKKESDQSATVRENSKEDHDSCLPAAVLTCPSSLRLFSWSQMTPEQQQWADAMKAMAKQAPQKGIKPPANFVRRMLWTLVTSTSFEGAITVAIVLNICVMACDYWGIEQNALDIG